ncbi:MAG: PEGA domain-containing protein [bacterium]|nr:PEGA domain-containing protein [bacterium]
MRKQFLIPLIILIFLITGTVLVVTYARGYRLGFDGGKPELSGTGLLVATSNPNGASVFINGHLTTATDNTLNLSPGNYTVRITKEGYFPWEKQIKIQKEVVSKAEALLFPSNPKLEGITASGVKNPKLDPSGSLIAYTIASESARKNGVYILDMSNRPILTLQSSSTQIADDTVDLFSQGLLLWSPDGQELIATISAQLGSQTTYLLKTQGFNQNPKDVTATLLTVQASWEKDRLEKERARKSSLKPELQKLIVENFNILAWSLDETKILYEASQSAELPLIIKPPLIGTDSTLEDRSIKKDSVYVYDSKEDKNFKIKVGNSENLSWFPDSKHLVYVEDKKIGILEYDGTNRTTIYAGPFVDNYVFSWPNGSKLVVLTNLGNENIPPNLYTIGLK